MLACRDDGGGMGAVLPLPTPSTSMTLLLVLEPVSLITKLAMFVRMLLVLAHCLVCCVRDMSPVSTRASLATCLFTHKSQTFKIVQFLTK